MVISKFTKFVVYKKRTQKQVMQDAQPVENYSNEEITYFVQSSDGTAHRNYSYDADNSSADTKITLTTVLTSVSHFATYILLISLLISYISKGEDPPIHFAKRDWPPIKIYYHRLPATFNKNILNKVPARMFEPYDIEFQFYIEVAFTSYLNQTGLLVKNKDEADFIYTDIYPTYVGFAKLSRANRLRLGKLYFQNLKKNGILQNKNIFSINAMPFRRVIQNFLFGYIGSFEVINRTNFFAIPYLSYFKHYLPSKVNFSAKRNYSVFMSGSAKFQRPRIFDLMKKIPNSYSFEMKRSLVNQMAEQLHEIPYAMAKSKYCVVPRGDSPSSKRFYDAVVYGCIPIIIADNFSLSFDKTQVNWDNCVLRIKESEVDTLPYVVGNITESEYQFMYNALMEAKEFVRFDNGVTPYNGVGSILWELYYSNKKQSWLKGWLTHIFKIIKHELNITYPSF